MRATFSDRVERGRVRTGTYGTSPGDPHGAFHLTTNAGTRLKVIVGAGDDEVPWQHVSVSTPTRCPTWDEMCWVKSLFFEDEECVVQFHPAKSQHISNHPFCLHMWRPIAAEMPTPPQIAVGLPGGLEADRAYLRERLGGAR